MCKLEEYKNKEASARHQNSLYGLEYAGFREGFDAAIALDLPIKFAEWKDVSLQDFSLRKLTDFTYQIDGKDKIYFTNQRLYKYWVNKILKLEL